MILPILRFLLKVVITGCALTGLQEAWLDLADSPPLKLIHDNGYLFGIREAETILWILFWRSWKIQHLRIELLVVMVNCRFWSHHILLSSMLGYVTYYLLRVHGILGHGFRRDSQIYGCSYLLYKMWSWIEWRSLCHDFEEYTTIPLQCETGTEHAVLSTLVRILPQSFYFISLVLVGCFTCTSLSDWHLVQNWPLALPLSYRILKSCTWESSAIIFGIAAFKCLNRGSLIIIDETTSAVIWISSAIGTYKGFQLGMHAKVIDEAEFRNPLGLRESFKIALYAVLAFIFCSIGYIKYKGEHLHTRLNYFNLQRQNKLFGQAAALSRETEPFMDRASRLNVNWYNNCMPNASSGGAECIRLLRIISFKGRIRCEVKSFGPGQKPPPYVALSYTCGDPDSPSLETSSRETLHSIWCNGQIFYTRPNLHDALTVFQRMGLTSWIWIDTICINQGSPDERLSQVARMGRIYEDAEEVLLWTGKLNSDMIDALAFYKDGWKSLAGTGAASESPLDVAWFERIFSRSEEEPSALISEWVKAVESMGKFWCRTWRCRAWILQEIALARSIKVYCGRIVLPWDILQESLVCMPLPDNTYPPNFRQEMQRIRRNLPYCSNSSWEYREFWLSIGGVSDANSFRAAYLLYLISATKGYVCTDPRDKIFCVYGMVNLDAPSSVDLRELHLFYDTTVEELYYWTSRYCILTCPSLMCLSLVTEPHESNCHLPSWVPKFDASDRIKPLLFNKNLGHGIHGKIFNTSEKHINGPILDVCGKIIDSVAEVCDMTLEQFLTHDVENLDPIFKFCDGIPFDCLDNHTTAEVLWRVLACIPRSSTSDTAVKAEDFCSWIELKLFMILETRFNKSLDKHGGQAHSDEETAQISKDFQADHRTLESVASACQGVMSLPKPKDVFRSMLEWKPPPEKSLMQSLLNWETIGHRLHPFYKAIAPNCTGRRLFRTQRGYIGMAIDSIRPGDDIVALKGSKIPFVLRRRPKNHPMSLQRNFPKTSQWAERDYNSMLRNGTLEPAKVGVFRVIGEAYLHGFMGGERVGEIACTEEDTIHLI